AVILDVSAACCATGAIASFILAGAGAQGWRRALWSLAFFLFLGLGMLAKGPIVVVISLAPIMLWSLFSGRWELVRALPWLKGGALGVAICLPWYLLAERATPGFLEYFFFNEHIGRFLSADYGDLYGQAHVRPYGSIWLMLAVGLLPWPLFFVAEARAGARGVRSLVPDRRSWGWLLLLWGLFPALFFTFARSVLPTYLLPGIGGLAIALAAVMWRAFSEGRGSLRLLLLLTGPYLLATWAGTGMLMVGSWKTLSFAGLALLSVALTLLLAVAIHLRSTPAPFLLLPLMITGACCSGWLVLGPELNPFHSSRDVMRAALAQLDGGDGRVVVVASGEESMGYYGKGRVIYLQKLDDPGIRDWLSDGIDDVYLVRARYVERLDARVRAALEPVEEVGPFEIFRDGGGEGGEPARVGGPSAAFPGHD
ncbi:MAG: hypothetical protein ACE5GW_10785, partial [Planctomycetota bacterium]